MENTLPKINLDIERIHELYPIIHNEINFEEEYFKSKREYIKNETDKLEDYFWSTSLKL